MPGAYQLNWRAVRNAVAAAKEHRQRVAEGDFTVFLFPLTLAIAKDFLVDILAAIPFAGLVIGTPFALFITAYLFIFMWGRGRIWLRILFLFIAVLDLIPFISLIPFDTVSVLFAYSLAKKDARESEEELEKAEKTQRVVRRQIERVVGRPDRMEQKTV